MKKIWLGLALTSATNFFMSEASLAEPRQACATEESTLFSVTYLGARAGTFEMNTKPGASGTCEESGSVRTDPVFSLFYRVENSYKSVGDLKTGLPRTFVTLLNESKQTGKTSLLFNRKRKVVQILDDRNHTKKGHLVGEKEVAILPSTQDVVSALFFLRRQDLKMGTVVDLPVFIGEELSNLKLTVVGEEKLSTKIGTKDAWIARPVLVKDGAEKPLPDTELWIAKDWPKQLLKIKAKVKIGSVIAYLLKYREGPESLP
jgi:hypothetical protein